MSEGGGWAPGCAGVVLKATQRGGRRGHSPWMRAKLPVRNAKRGGLANTFLCGGLFLMTTFRLLQRELSYRKLNVVLTLFALTAAATLFVAGPTLLEGYRGESQRQLEAMRDETDAALAVMQQETDRELEKLQTKANGDLAELENRTRRIMRDLGFNLRIVHRDTDLTKLYAQFVSLDMPEEYVTRLAESPQITKIAHLVATLRQMIDVDGQARLVVGFAPEATQSHAEKKSPMGFQIERGKVYLGAVAGEGYAVGDAFPLRARSFTVARILPPHGTAEEDIAICLHLQDAQELLERPGRITEILALGCKCTTVNRVEEIMAQLELVLPEARVLEHRLQAIAREDQRKLVETHHAQLMDDYRANRGRIVEQERQTRERIIAKEREHRAGMMLLLARVNSVGTPLVVLVCAIWVGMLAWTNVRERRSEIGLLRALGKGTLEIATLFLGKAMLLGSLAGLAGCLLGSALAAWLATGILGVAPTDFSPALVVLLATMLGTPLVAIMASYLPTLAAVNQDPAVVLLE